MAKKRVVITGIGVVSPIGIGKEQFWESLWQGKSGFRPITLFNTKDLKVKIAGEITGFDPREILKGVNIRDLDRATLLLLTATKLALNDARVEIQNETSAEVGVSVGTTFGSLYSISEFDKESIKDGPRYANPSVFPSTVGNSPASRVSIVFGIKGFNATISTGMSAALNSIEYAKDFLDFGRAKSVICGSVEALSPQIFLGFYKLDYLSGLNGNSAPISCPFDKRRNGIVYSEGSVVFLLENLEDAQKRNAKIYAEIAGIGSSFDAAKFYKYNPKGIGMRKAMKSALENARLKPRDIDCIFANANSTKDADLIETNAIKDVFGDYSRKIPVTAVKSIVGETYSASGGISLAAAIGAMNKGLIPATIHLENPDPVCDLDYVPNKPRSKKISQVMINTFGPNGANTSLIIRSPS